MTVPTTLADTELAAVNDILSAVGQAPVTTLDQDNPEIAIAYNTLLQCSRECQAEGWVFNTELNYPLATNSDDEIELPENMLKVDLTDNLSNAGIDAVRRDGRLYNNTDHTFKWTYSPVFCDITWLFGWNDLPQVFKDYITVRAAAYVALKVVGDQAQYQLLSQREGLARASVMEYECNQGDYSMFGFPRGDNYYQSYSPLNTILR
jgi:hypothetical protein